jgi:cation diffusion facilitator family transporter
MAISIIASFLLSRHLRRVAKATDSTAIEASARNISADVFSATGVLLGLLVVRITKLEVLDPIIALIMAGFVIKAGYEVTVRAIHELVDYTLPTEEREIINNCIMSHKTQLVEFHALRSRRAGSERFVDLHVVLPRSLSVTEAHDICDHLEQDIKSNLVNANVIIHAEPCNVKDCLKCFITVCNFRHN